MMQQLRAYTERLSAAAARVVGFASDSVDGALTTLGMTTDTTAMFAWNVKPSVHVNAICTHGKRYERRLQEMLT